MSVDRAAGYCGEAETGQRELEWVTCPEAAARVNEPELKGLFRLLEGSFPASSAVSNA
jgi:hypothetical protein